MRTSIRRPAALILISIICFLIAIFRGGKPPEEVSGAKKNGQVELNRDHLSRQTVILLELSQAFLASNPNILSEDFISAFNVASGLIDAFIKSGKPGDKVWIAGYSDVNLNAETVLGPFESSNPKLKSLRELFSISAESSDLDRETKIKTLIAGGFFPSSNSNSDAFMAINKAAEILSLSPRYGISKNKIALITSGLFTCQRSFKEDYLKFCEEGKLASCPSPLCEPLPSKRAFDANQLAYRELIEIVAPKLSDLGIAVNSYLVGKRVVPHSLLFPNPNKAIKACMTAEEIEQRNYPNVTWRRFRIPLKDPNEEDFKMTFGMGDKDSFYLAPNILLSSFSKSTSGKFYPVRTRCPSFRYSGFRDISGDGNWGGIDDVCVWSQISKSFNNQPQFLAEGEEAIGLKYIVHSQELVDSGVTDTDGRLLCEPGELLLSAR